MRPKHYEAKTDWFDFCYQNEIKDPCVIHAGSYLTRLGKKEGVDPVDDLDKAIYCLQRARKHYQKMKDDKAQNY